MSETYSVRDIGAVLRGNPYPGRGIVMGGSADGESACAAYFIMGRSANSRNRVLALRGGALFTQPADPARVEDPSLIIYAAMKSYENGLIITNGDHTDTVLAGLKAGLTLSEALKSRSFEPDAPNLTPRISGLMSFGDGTASYELSILKSVDAQGSGCAGYCFSYPLRPGLGHLIHTYAGDGCPLPSFQGEPERLRVPADIDEFTRDLWSALDEENRIALYVRYTGLSTGEVEERLINKRAAEAHT